MLIKDIERDVRSKRDSGARQVRLTLLGYNQDGSDESKRPIITSMCEFQVIEDSDHRSAILKSGKLCAGIRKHVVSHLQSSTEYRVEAINSVHNYH